ncbi:MAG TPA: hypothetical protein VFV50_00590, partial [Bdellovibrionales bacterium]|nr:hypothetical protein [Bdellovibrionales bacterium]
TIKPRSSVPLLIYFEFTNEPCRHVSALLPPMPQLSTPTALEYELAGVLISNTRKIEISFFTSPEPEEDIGKFRKHGQVNFTLEPFQSYQRWDLQTPQPREIHRPTTFGHKCL